MEEINHESSCFEFARVHEKEICKKRTWKIYAKTKQTKQPHILNISLFFSVYLMDLMRILIFVFVSSTNIFYIANILFKSWFFYIRHLFAFSLMFHLTNLVFFLNVPSSLINKLYMYNTLNDTVFCCLSKNYILSVFYLSKNYNQNKNSYQTQLYFYKLCFFIH